MKALQILSVVFVAASCSLAQDTTPAPRPRAASNRAIHIVRAAGGSYLGIGVAEIDADRAKGLNLKEVHGVEVKSVDSASPAAKAGLKEGDVVLEYNGQRIEGTEQFIRLVRETPVDRQVRLQVWRNGAAVNLTATIGHRASDHVTMIGGDDDGDMTVEIPPMPLMPPMPAMPPMPPMPEMPRVWNSTRSGMLGVETEALGSQLADFFGVKEGVLVRSVVKDSVAEKAGIHAGDVIVRINGESVTTTREVSALLRSTLRAKKTFPIVVVRDKKEVTLSATFDSSTVGQMVSPHAST